MKVGIQLIQFAPHILAELNGIQGEALIRPLGLHLKGTGSGQLVVQELVTCSHNGILVLLAGPGQRQAHNAEHLLQGLKGALHVALVILGLHIGGGLAGIDFKLAVGPQTPVDIGLKLILKAAAVKALQHHLSQLQQDDLIHNTVSLSPVFLRQLCGAAQNRAYHLFTHAALRRFPLDQLLYFTCFPPR